MTRGRPESSLADGTSLPSSPPFPTPAAFAEGPVSDLHSPSPTPESRVLSRHPHRPSSRSGTREFPNASPRDVSRSTPPRLTVQANEGAVPGLVPRAEAREVEVQGRTPAPRRGRFGGRASVSRPAPRMEPYLEAQKPAMRFRVRRVFVVLVAVVSAGAAEEGQRLLRRAGRAGRPARAQRRVREPRVGSSLVTCGLGACAEPLNAARDRGPGRPRGAWSPRARGGLGGSSGAV